MKPAVDNYALQLQKTQKCFLTYDQQALIVRCALRFDKAIFTPAASAMRSPGMQ